MYSIDLKRVIFCVHSPTTHRPHLRLQGVGGHQLQLAVTFGVSAGKVNCACYIAQLVNPVLLPFLRKEGDVLFQKDNKRPHMAAAMKHALCGA